MRKLTFIWLLLLSIGCLFASPHFNLLQPQTIGDEIIFGLEIPEAYNDISEVALHYKASDASVFTTQEMTKATYPLFKTGIDLTGLNAGLSYYFTVELNDGSTYTYPAENATNNPFMYTIPQRSGAEKRFVLLSPSQTFLNAEDDLLIAVSAFALQETIDVTTFKVFVNNIDRTSLASVSGPMLVLKLENPKAGSYGFYVTAKTTGGKMLESAHWSVRVNSKPLIELPLNLKGEISLQTIYNDLNYDTGEDQSHGEARYKLNFSGNKNWYAFQGDINLSSDEKSNAQSINRYSLKSYFPHANLFLGDYNPNYGSFVMNNRNIRGYHAKIYSQNFAVMTSYGQTRRKQEGAYTLSDTTQASTITRNSVFERNSFAGRIELGNTSSVLFGLSFSKTKDDLGSLNRRYFRNFTATADSVFYEDQLLGKDNFVVGTDLSFAFWQQRLKLGMETAMSFYNNNINTGGKSKDDLENEYDIDAPFDPDDFHNILIINQNLEPFKPGFQNLASKIYLTGSLPNTYLSASYTAIGSSFNSLATDVNQKDIAIFSLNGSTYLLNNRLTLSAGMNFSGDNLSDQKTETTKNNSYYLNANYLPLGQPMSLRASANVSTVKNDASDPLYAIEQDFNQFGAGLTYSFQQFSFAENKLNLDYSSQTSKDEEKNAFDIARNLITLGIESDYRELPLRTNFAYSFTDSKEKYPLKASTTNTDYNSFMFKAEYKLLEETLLPYASLRYSSYQGDIPTQNLTSYSMGASYALTHNTMLVTDFDFLNFSAASSAQDYSKFYWNFKVSQKF